IPSPVKRIKGARQIPLPPENVKGEFPTVLLNRRTWRHFSARRLERSDLGTLLGLTWKVQRWIHSAGAGRVALKTSPSGGARHPIEAYVLALRVDELPRGLYHYSAQAHALELIAPRASSRAVARYLPTQWWYESAAAVFLMTGVFARTQWKYEIARAYRA